MGSAILKFATWNIGGGILGESHQRDGRPSLDYHISILKEYAPDVVCFQEAHDYQGRQEGQAEYIASQSGYPYVATFPISESHMEKGASLTLAVLSRFPIRDTEYRQFANPGLKGTGPNGEEWKLFDKGYAIGAVDVGGQPIGVVNAHCFPLHYFGASAVESRFASMWSALACDLLSVRKQHPTLVAIDLNYEPVQDVLMEAVRQDAYMNAFEGTPTIPKGAQQDYILYDHVMRLLATTVKPTESDHSYCQVSVLV